MYRWTLIITHGTKNQMVCNCEAEILISKVFRLSTTETDHIPSLKRSCRICG